MKKFFSIGLALFLFPTLAFAQVDTDGDGIDDLIDLCPAEDASFFDADGDGCLDPTRHARHVEFWVPADFPLQYVIHQDGAPNISDGSDFAAIQNGFSVWSSVPGVTLSSSYAGTTSTADADGLDGINSVTFEDSQFLAIYGSSVLAVGITTSFEEPSEFMGRAVLPGQIVDADMIFNPNRLFSTDTGGVGPDLMSVAVHESGHLFGFAHSSVITSTMFPALPSGTNARSLEAEDELLAFMSYPDSAALASANLLAGVLRDGATLGPIGGAAVFAISATSGDTIGAQYTFADGSYQFVGLPDDDYYVSVSPLSGSYTNGVVPGMINSLVDSIAVNRLWNPESWDFAESNADNDGDRDPVTVSGGIPATSIDIQTNVDSTGPSLATVAPDGAEIVRADAVFFIEFDEDIDFQSATSNVKLNRMDGGTPTPVAFALLQVSSDKVLIVDPAGLMDYGAQYELVLESGIADRFGNAMGSDATTSFTVEPIPPLEIRTLAPSLVTAKTVVVIYGQGFDISSVEANTVNFGGVEATPLTVNPNALSVVVPDEVPYGTFDLTVTTTTETSNVLTVTSVVSSDDVKGSTYERIALAGAPEAVVSLPDATYSYVATSEGLEFVATGFTNPQFGQTGLVPVTGGTNALAVAPAGDRVYAVSRSGAKIIALNSDYGDIFSPSPTFNTLVDEIPTWGTPLGIAIDPAGERAYVSTAEGVVEVWDIELGSGTYHRQVGVLSSSAVSLRDAVAVDRTGLRVLGLSGGGDLLIWDSSNPTAAPQSVAILGDPRDITIDPQGIVAYVTSTTGEVTVVLLSTGAVSQVISTGGSPVAMAVTPSGNRGYVVDRPNDALPSVDLRTGSAAFRTVTATLDVGSQPVDVVLSPDADYLLSLEAGVGELHVLGISEGPEIFDIHPRWAKPGDVVTIRGTGFAFMHPDTGITSWNRVYFGSESFFPTYATGTSIEAIVPEGFTGGPVRVSYSGAVCIPCPDEYFSNPVRLGFIEEKVPSPTEEVSESVFLEPAKGYPWAGAFNTQTVEASPTGEFILTGMVDSSGAPFVYMIDSSAQSSTRGEVIGTIALTANMKPGRLVIAPDGLTAYFAGVDQFIHILDLDPQNTSYLQEVGVMVNALPTSTVWPDLMEITPSGEFLLVSDEMNDQLYLCDLREASTDYRTAFAETGPLGYATGLAVHPSGRVVYFAATTGQLHVVDLDPVRPTYMQQIGVNTGVAGPRDVDFSPDGARAYVLAREFAGGTMPITLDLMDTSDPYLPVHQASQELGSTAQVGPMQLFMAPGGDRAIASLAADSVQIYLDVRDDLNPTAIFTDLGSPPVWVGDAAFDADGGGLWSARTYEPGIVFIDLRASYKMNFLSGYNQVGIAGQPLPVPLVLAADNGAGGRTPGAVAEVRVISGGGTVGEGKAYQWVTADEEGLFQIDWTLGPDPDVDPSNPDNALSISLNDGFTVIDNFRLVSVADPETLPLAQSQVLPLDGTTGVSVTTTVQVKFSKAVDPASVDPGSLTLRRQDGGQAVAVVYGFSSGNAAVSMTPLALLDPTTTYEIVSTAAILDASGAALSNPTTTTFVTQEAPALTLTSVSPPAATVGTKVVVSGTGFVGAAADYTVHFGAASAKASTLGLGHVTAYVPLGATTGSLTVSDASRTSNARNFSVLVPETAPLDEIVSTVTTGISVQSVAVTPDGAKAYTVSTEANQVLPVDLTTFTNLPAIAVGSSPRAVVIHPDGSKAYVTNFGSGTVSVIDVALDVVTTTIVVGTNPVELVASPTGDRLYVVNQLDQTLSVIDIDAESATYHTVVASTTTTKSTKGATITPDGTTLYLGTADGFIAIKVDPVSFGVVASTTTGKSTKGTAITPDGTLLLLVTTGNEILVVDVSPGGGNAVVASTTTGKNTTGAAITPDGSLLYILEEGSDEVVVVELNIGTSVGTSVISSPLLVTLTVLKTVPLDEEPAVIAFDPSGSGLAIVGHQSSSGRLTFLNVGSTPFGQLDTHVEVHPQTLSFGSRGRYVTGIIELPGSYYVENVELESIRLNDTLQVVVDKTEFKDLNQDTIRELYVKFDRGEVQSVLPQGDAVEVVLSGYVGPDHRFWTGVDTIRTMRPHVTHPAGGEVLVLGQVTQVTWVSPEDVNVAAVDVYYTVDDGETWNVVAEGVPDQGMVTWEVPTIPTAEALVEVTLYDNRGEPIGIGISGSTFMILEQPVPVAMQEVDLKVEGGAGRISWKVATSSGLEGFSVYRSDEAEGHYAKVSAEVVRAEIVDGGARFLFEDDSIFANRDYFYMLREESASGSGFEHGPYRLNWELANELRQNTPNTFNPRTTIEFSIAQDGRTRLAIYNVAGRLVDVLVDEELQASTYKKTWDGTDRQGRSVASGVYIYRLSAPGGFTATRKMTLVR